RLAPHGLSYRAGRLALVLPAVAFASRRTTAPIRLLRHRTLELTSRSAAADSPDPAKTVPSPRSSSYPCWTSSNREVTKHFTLPTRPRRGGCNAHALRGIYIG